MNFQQAKQEFDELLQGTQFSCRNYYKMVKDDNGRYVAMTELEGIAIHKTDDICCLAVMTSTEDIEMMKAFINTWRQPLIDIREAIHDEINISVGCTTDVVDEIINRVVNWEGLSSDIDLSHENAPFLDDPFLDDPIGQAYFGSDTQLLPDGKM